jgi:hypothetical protein
MTFRAPSCMKYLCGFCLPSMIHQGSVGNIYNSESSVTSIKCSDFYVGRFISRFLTEYKEEYYSSFMDIFRHINVTRKQ